jgi:hypothetical protein
MAGVRSLLAEIARVGALPIGRLTARTASRPEGEQPPSALATAASPSMESDPSAVASPRPAVDDAGPTPAVRRPDEERPAPSAQTRAAAIASTPPREPPPVASARNAPAPSDDPADAGPADPRADDPVANGSLASPRPPTGKTSTATQPSGLAPSPRVARAETPATPRVPALTRGPLQAPRPLTRPPRFEFRTERAAAAPEKPVASPHTEGLEPSAADIVPQHRVAQHRAVDTLAVEPARRPAGRPHDPSANAAVLPRSRPLMNAALEGKAEPAGAQRGRGGEPSSPEPGGFRQRAITEPPSGSARPRGELATVAAPVVVRGGDLLIERLDIQIVDPSPGPVAPQPYIRQPAPARGHAWWPMPERLFPGRG